MKLLIAGIVVLVGLFAYTYANKAKAQNVEGVSRLSVPDFAKQLTDSVQLVDVRTSGEFARGHIANALNIDIMSANFSQAMSQLNKQAPIYVYCARGNRSMRAAMKLHELGFEQIYDLRSGIMGWMQAGKEVQK